MVSLCKKSLSHISAVILALALLGCSDIPEKRAKVSGPWLADSLLNGKSAGVVDGGLFTEEGWAPNEGGTITYSLPGLSQGVAEFDIQGLNRNHGDVIFFTLFETPLFVYPDPYILKNPYRVTLGVNAFERHPQTPFQLVWTIKNFPAATPEKERYIQGIPEGIEGVEEYVSSTDLPVFTDQTYHVALEWKNGIARFSVDGQVLAECNYQPLVFNADSLKLVLGKTPGAETFPIPNVVYSNVKVSFPTL